MLKRKNKRNSGITLIALVITIIVLLILAGVSIATLTGNNGILSQAQNAKVETRGAAVEEARDLWKQETLTASKTGEDAKELSVLLDELEKQGLLIGNEKQTILDTGKVTIGTRTIEFTEETLELGYKIIKEYRNSETNAPYTIIIEPKKSYEAFAYEKLSKLTPEEKEKLYLDEFNRSEIEDGYITEPIESIEKLLEYFYQQEYTDKLYSSLDEYFEEYGTTIEEDLINNLYVYEEEWLNLYGLIGELTNPDGETVDMLYLNGIYEYDIDKAGIYTFKFKRVDGKEAELTINLEEHKPIVVTLGYEYERANVFYLMNGYDNLIPIEKATIRVDYITFRENNGNIEIGKEIDISSYIKNEKIILDDALWLRNLEFYGELTLETEGQQVKWNGKFDTTPA